MTEASSSVFEGILNPHLQLARAHPGAWPGSRTRYSVLLVRAFQNFGEGGPVGASLAADVITDLTGPCPPILGLAG